MSVRGLALASAMSCLIGWGAEAATAPPTVMWGDGVRVVHQGTRHEAWYDLYVDGPNRMAVGAAGAVRQSGDGGKTWATFTLPTQGRSLFALTGQGRTRVAVGQSGLIFRTDDAAQWHLVASGTQSRLMAVHMSSRGLAYAVGAFGTVLRSADAGKTWQPQPPQWADFTIDGAEPHLYGVHVAEDGTATMAGEFGLVLRVDPSGKVWQVLHRGEASLFGLTVAQDRKTWYAVGQGGYAIVSDNDGKTWRALATATNALLTRVTVSSSGAVLAIGANAILRSRDGGASWHHVGALPPNAWLQAVSPLPPAPGQAAHALAAGADGVLVEIAD